MRTFAIAAALVVTGCNATDPSRRSDLDCAAGLQTLLEEVRARWSDPATCVSDSDCIAAGTDTSCPDDGAILYSCPFVIHRDSEPAFADVLAEVQAEVCPRVDPDCHGGAGCVLGTPTCVDGRCTGVMTVPRDGGDSDAG